MTKPQGRHAPVERIYNNPSTTDFIFSDASIAKLASVPDIAAIKMPLPSDNEYEGELARLHTTTPVIFAIGYSGDWNACASLLAGANARYSVISGLLPEPALRLTRTTQARRKEEAETQNEAFAPLWALFAAHGGLRVMYVIAERLWCSSATHRRC